MRRLVYVLIVLATAAALYFLTRAREEKTIPGLSMSPPRTPREMLENAPVVVPGHDVVISLDRGLASFESGPVKGSVTLGGAFATARTPEGIDFLGYISVNSGGSGTFSYLTLHSMNKQGLTHHDSAFLGDRIIVRSIRAEQQRGQEEYRVVVAILDRGPDEPMSAPPAVERELTFTISDHRFVTGKLSK